MGSSLVQSSSLTSLLDTSLEELEIPPLEPQRNCPIAQSPNFHNGLPRHQHATPVLRSPSAPLPWDGNINWSVKGPSAFDDNEEELEAVNCRPAFQSYRSSDLWIFQYGLRYLPGVGETNRYRTVKVEQVPRHATLGHILAKAEGEVYSASLADTSAITGSNTAIVVFVFERDAEEFVNGTRSGLRIGETLAKTSLVHTPTYPMSAEMKSLIFQHGRTRCLVIYEITKSQVEILNSVLGQFACRQYVESHVSEEGVIYVRFPSIRMATSAYNMLKSDPTFHGCYITFCRSSAGSWTSPRGTD